MGSSKLDRELGIDREITRRDFIYGSSLLVGGALAGCNPTGDSAPAASQDYGFTVGNDWYGLANASYRQTLLVSTEARRSQKLQ